MHQFKPQTLLPNLLAGLIVGLVTLIYSISCAALIFSGSLASFFAQGMVNALVGAIVVVVVALRSPLPFTIAGPDPKSAVLLGAMASTIAFQQATNYLLAERLSQTYQEIERLLHETRSSFHSLDC